MALMHGKTALIQWDADASDTNLQHGQSWSLDVSHDTSETTSMGDAWKSFIGDFTNWTATIECLQDTAGPDIGLGGDDGLADDECYLEMYCVYATGDYKCFYGKAICIGINPGQNANGTATIGYTFQGVDALVWHSGAARPAY